MTNKIKKIQVERKFQLEVRVSSIGNNDIDFDYVGNHNKEKCIKRLEDTIKLIKDF